jgi:uncharacterized membrane protein YGL010W
MRTVDLLLSEYGESHKNPTNKAIHWICVPVIFWTVVALLWSVKTPYMIPKLNMALNAAMIGLALALVYYTTLSALLALGMLLFSTICMALSYYVEIALQPSGFPLWAVALIVFVLAWIGQFWGHSIEGKKPSFLKDLQFLLIGPAWLMHFIFKKAGISY